MVTYKVTTELKTSWWLKILRFFRLKSKREDFELSFEKLWFKEGDIVDCGKSNTITTSVTIIGISAKKN